MNRTRRKGIACLIGLSAIAMAQTTEYNGRVGINTTTPNATLQIEKKAGLPEDKAQGVTFPNFTTAERTKFKNVPIGTMIFNTSVKCLEMYMGKENNVDKWACMNISNSNSVDNGSANPNTKTEYVVSMTHQGTSVQGKINNTTNKLTIKIPYTGGSGYYNTVESPAVVSAAGQGGDINNLSLKVNAGNFSSGNMITATVNVKGTDNEYLVKQLAPGEEEDIATIPVTVGQTTFTVVLKAIGGVLDRCFGKTTIQCVGYGANVKEHEFIYIPITGPDGRTWLNNNLGAEYARVGSPYFSPTTQE